jgi:hypothetical protein
LPLERTQRLDYTSPVRLRRLISSALSEAFKKLFRSTRLQTHGPLGTLWVSLGLGCFYIALIWLNTLLGFFLTPLFVIPVTWVTDRLGERRSARQI